jgi:YjbE family integral membrane protein
MIDAGTLTAFGEVLMIDLVLAGDNAIVVGALAAGLPASQRKQVILIGIGAALVLRIGFALIVTQLLQVIGLILAGGLLLLWVAWKMYRELAGKDHSPGSAEIQGDEHAGVRPVKSFAAAAWAVALADVSMSLDNVLAVAGADHFVTPDKQALIHEGLDDHPRVTIYDYPGEDHGFATESGNRRSEQAAQLADSRTEAFFAAHIG